MREWLALTLQALDVTVVQASNGHELASIVSARRDVDLVISDIRMPGPSGVEVLAATRDRGNPVPFLLITGYGDPEVLAAAERLGATVLQKPFSRRELLARVDALCGLRSVGGAIHGNLAHASDGRK